MQSISDLVDVFHNTIRHLWLVLFVGWWLLCLIGTLRASPVSRVVWLVVPLAFTVVGIVVSLISTSTTYSAVQDPGHFTMQLDPCDSWHQPDERDDCYSDDAEAQAHFASFAVLDHDGNIDFWPTWVNVFADTVSYVQIIWAWLAVPALFLWWRISRSPSSQQRESEAGAS